MVHPREVGNKTLGGLLMSGTGREIGELFGNHARFRFQILLFHTIYKV